MGKLFIKQNINYLALILFFICFATILYSKPAFIYNNDGSLKHFGVEYKNKSVLPMWFIVIILAILSYTSVLYLVTFSKNIY